MVKRWFVRQFGNIIAEESSIYGYWMASGIMRLEVLGSQHQSKLLVF